MKMMFVFLALLFLVFPFSVSAQSSSTVSIEEYFPMKLGSQWRYQGTGDMTTIVTVQDEDKTADGSHIAVFSTTESLMGITTTRLYESKGNKIELLVSQNILIGRRNHEDEIILAVPGQSWQYGDLKNEYTICKSYSSSITVDGTRYSDCICVEKTTRYLSNNNWNERRSRLYYARGTGMVYREVLGNDGNWKMLEKLTVFRK